jgi:DNA-binding transcriptional regulator YdaS (Cro superfamily)
LIFPDWKMLKMKLKDWLTKTGIQPSDFAKTIETQPAAVSRYCAGTRIPEKEVMPRIVAATNGEVTPNDFYGVDVAGPQPSGDAGFDGGEVARLAGARLGEAQLAREPANPRAGSHLRAVHPEGDRE